MTERLHFHFSLPCIGERNGNPLQCSCLENPRDGGAWWAAVYGVAQSWTRLKRLSSKENYSAIKNFEIMVFVATWMDLEMFILTEERQIPYGITYMWILKKRLK